MVENPLAAFEHLYSETVLARNYVSTIAMFVRYILFNSFLIFSVSNHILLSTFFFAIPHFIYNSFKLFFLWFFSFSFIQLIIFLFFLLSILFFLHYFLFTFPFSNFLLIHSFISWIPHHLSLHRKPFENFTMSYGASFQLHLHFKAKCMFHYKDVIK